MTPQNFVMFQFSDIYPIKDPWCNGDRGSIPHQVEMFIKNLDETLGKSPRVRAYCARGAIPHYVLNIMCGAS